MFNSLCVYILTPIASKLLLFHLQLLVSFDHQLLQLCFFLLHFCNDEQCIVLYDPIVNKTKCKASQKIKTGPVRELNPGPLAP